MSEAKKRNKPHKGGKGAKRAKELKSRIADYEATIRKLSPKQAGSYKRPGSMSGKK